MYDTSNKWKLQMYKYKDNDSGAHGFQQDDGCSKAH
jgi:hypothetical protein